MTSHKFILPQELTSRYKFVREYTYGGSTSRVFLVKEKNKLLVLKYATIEGIGYNGKPWNKQQFLKLNNFQECLPQESANLFPKVFEYNETDSYNYYTMEYFDGISVPNIFFKKQRSFTSLADNLLKTLKYNLYLLDIRKCAPNYITDNHYNRIVHRIGLLNLREGNVYNSFIKNHEINIDGERYNDVAFFFDRLFENKKIEINGYPYLNMPQIIGLIKQNLDELNKNLSPQYLPVYVHGDLLLRNILLGKTGEIKLIDVRGENINEKIPSLISLEYEAGKILHSFLLELTRNNLLLVEVKKHENKFKFYITFKKNSIVSTFLNARKIMPDFIKENFKDTIFWGNENKFLYHTLFSEASHFAADAINRLAQDPSGNHTLAYYIISIILFDDILRKLEMLEPGSQSNFNDIIRC